RYERSGATPRRAPGEIPGTIRLYTDHRFPTPDGRARLAPTPHSDPAETPDGDFPLLLTSGRVANHWHTLTRTGKSKALVQSAGEPFVEVHPEDAKAAGLKDGESACVISRRGRAKLQVKLDSSLPRGVVFAPFHWGALHAPPGAGQVNATTVSATDPVSHQPELKAAAVRIEPVLARPRRLSARRHRQTVHCGRRLVLVGTGMAALETVEEVLRRRPEGEWHMTMLGEEPGTVYNRILLSKVLARTVSAEAIELRPPAWYPKHGVELRGGLPAVAVDAERRLVTDGNGCVHRYDALVLATGSRPFVPPITGAQCPHVHTFRTRTDVAALAAAAVQARRAVIVGGGLLGLEAAAGLRVHGVKVTVVEAGPRLMPQQLDEAGAALLERELARLGIETVTSTTVEEIGERSVTLQGGEQLAADLVVIAAGVRAETSLARAAGIEVARGMLVDDEMRTSAPAVWAVGECAEHRGTVHGLWAPLAEQARVAGASVCGDPGAFHGGVPVTTLKVAGVELFAGGAQAATNGQDELIWSDSRRSVYRKLVLDGDRLAGAVLLGDATAARELSTLLRSGTPVPEQVLLAPGAAGQAATAEPSPGETVCSCNSVTRGEIQTAIRTGGLLTLTQVGRVTRAATGCGSCAGEVEALLRAADEATRDSSSRNIDVTARKQSPATIEA
ncbi:MAG: FAD-dependent oxidoreductase, partial [Solirubrobacteraceae bacterium]